MTVKRKEYQLPMEAWPALAPYKKENFIFNRSTKIFLYEAGLNNPQSILLIHGLGDEADTWRHIFLPLSERFHVVAMDLPGFGRSDSLKEPYKPEIIMASILDTITVLGLEHPILMGSSLGAIFSHAIAIDYPELISGLILVGGGLSRNYKMGDFSLRLMQLPLIGEWFYTHLRKDPDAAYASIRNVYFDLDQMPGADRKFLYQRVNKRVWSNKQRTAYFSTLRNVTQWARRQQNHIKGKLRQLEIPTLILRGRHDGLFSTENGVEIVNIQSKAAFIEVEKAGHLPHQEAPVLFLEYVMDWLKTTVID
jgi:pimeloyl-ACP methyl ester carboxylesterase